MMTIGCLELFFINLMSRSETKTFRCGHAMYETTFKKISIGYLWSKATVNSLKATTFEISTNYVKIWSP